ARHADAARVASRRSTSSCADLLVYREGCRARVSGQLEEQVLEAAFLRAEIRDPLVLPRESAGYALGFRGRDRDANVAVAPLGADARPTQRDHSGVEIVDLHEHRLAGARGREH